MLLLQDVYNVFVVLLHDKGWRTTLALILPLVQRRVNACLYLLLLLLFALICDMLRALADVDESWVTQRRHLALRRPIAALRRLLRVRRYRTCTHRPHLLFLDRCFALRELDLCQLLLLLFHLVVLLHLLNILKLGSFLLLLLKVPKQGTV